MAVNRSSFCLSFQVLLSASQEAAECWNTSLLLALEEESKSTESRKRDDLMSLREDLHSLMNYGPKGNAAALSRMREVSLREVIVEMQPFLTSDSSKEVNIALRVLAAISTSNTQEPRENVNESDVILILQFFVEKLSNFMFCDASLEGIGALLKAYLSPPRIASDEAGRVLSGAILKLHVPGLTVEGRRVAASIYSLLLERYEHLCLENRTATDFLRAFLAAFEGETDPEMVMHLFRLHYKVQLVFPAEKLAFILDDLFDMVANYFPILFTPPPSCPISREMLRNALCDCFTATTIFGEFLLPFFCSKLSSPSFVSKRDSLEMIEKMMLKLPFEHSQSSWSEIATVLRNEALKLTPLQQTNPEATELVKLVCTLLGIVGDACSSYANADLLLSVASPLIRPCVAAIDADSTSVKVYATLMHSFCVGSSKCCATLMFHVILEIMQRAEESTSFRRTESCVMVIAAVLSAAEKCCIRGDMTGLEDKGLTELLQSPVSFAAKQLNDGSTPLSLRAAAADVLSLYICLDAFLKWNRHEQQMYLFSLLCRAWWTWTESTFVERLKMYFERIFSVNNTQVLESLCDEVHNRLAQSSSNIQRSLQLLDIVAEIHTRDNSGLLFSLGFDVFSSAKSAEESDVRSKAFSTLFSLSTHCSVPATSTPELLFRAFAQLESEDTGNHKHADPLQCSLLQLLLRSSNEDTQSSLVRNIAEKNCSFNPSKPYWTDVILSVIPALSTDALSGLLQDADRNMLLEQVTAWGRSASPGDGSTYINAIASIVERYPVPSDGDVLSTLTGERLQDNALTGIGVALGAFRRSSSLEYRCNLLQLLLQSGECVNEVAYSLLAESIPSFLVDYDCTSIVIRHLVSAVSRNTAKFSEHVQLLANLSSHKFADAEFLDHIFTFLKTLCTGKPTLLSTPAVLKLLLQLEETKLDEISLLFLSGSVEALEVIAELSHEGASMQVKVDILNFIEYLARYEEQDENRKLRVKKLILHHVKLATSDPKRRVRMAAARCLHSWYSKH